MLLAVAQYCNSAFCVCFNIKMSENFHLDFSGCSAADPTVGIHFEYQQSKIKDDSIGRKSLI